MDQFEKMILNRHDSIRMSDRIIIDMITVKNIDRIFANFDVFIIDHFEIALLRWRRGESPVADMTTALDWANKTVAAIEEWQPGIDIIKNVNWFFAKSASILLDRPLSLPDPLWQQVKARADNYSSNLNLEFLLLDALEGHPYHDHIPQMMARFLAARKGREPASQTYKTYFALLDSARDAGVNAPATEALIRQAEVNYTNRARDPFFCGGVGTMGGDLNNPYVVDFMLAAILKKIGWEGDSIHRWRWG